MKRATMWAVWQYGCDPNDEYAKLVVYEANTAKQAVQLWLESHVDCPLTVAKLSNFKDFEIKSTFKIVECKEDDE